MFGGVSTWLRSLHPPNQQSHGNRRSRDREDWQPKEMDQRHRERRHESTADNGARDDLPIAVASHDIRLPQGVDHVDHHEAASEHALGFAELGNGMLEPVPREDASPDDQYHEDAPANRGKRQYDQRADMSADRSQRQ